MKPSNPSTSTLDDKRRRAYQAGGRITRDRMTREAPMNAEALDAIEASDIVVVEGCYDHVELVVLVLQQHVERRDLVGRDRRQQDCYCRSKEIACRKRQEARTGETRTGRKKAEREETHR